MKNIITILLAIVLFSVIVSAAPALWGIAINSETRECGGYWAGDEYVSARLPDGWKAYYSEGNDIIKTEFGECEFRKDVGDSSGEEEKCCNGLGLNFVSADIGEVGLFSYPMINFLIIGILFILFVVGLITLIVWIIIKRLKKK